MTGEPGDSADTDLGVSLLSRLDPAMVDELLKVGEAVHVRAGDWLFRAGDDGDALYIVEAGRLEVFADDDGVDRLVRPLVVGDAVGELALVCRAPRSAGVRAVRDSELLRISHDDCMQLVRKDELFALALLASIGEKLRSTVGHQLDTSGARVLAVVPLDAAAPVTAIAEGVTRVVGGWGKVACLMPGSFTDDEAMWGTHVDACEREHDFVILVSDEVDSHEGWGRFCTRQADRVLAVAGGTPQASMEPRPGWDLALCGRANQAGAHRPWLDTVRPRAHHAVRTHASEGDIERLTRRVLGRSVGLVLSGGGARGLAHLGVLDVLVDAGLAVDRIGGTSMGAYIAALFASGRTPRELSRVCRAELVDHRPFRDFTLPRTSLIRARKAEAMLERVFGTAHLEDLAVECFAVSADLTTAEVVVHRRGSIVEAVGASMSLPGVAPPIRSGSRLLVDGGVLNNVPADVMAATGEGPVIAVDVMTRIQLGSSRRMPSIVETIARATVIGSHHQAATRLLAAAAVIEPDVGTVGLFEFARFDEIVEAGRQAARRALEAGTLPGV